MNNFLYYFDVFLTLIVRCLGHLFIFFSKNLSFKIFSFRLPIKEQIIFMKRLSMLLRSGMPILVGLEMLEVDAHTKSSKLFIRSLTNDIEAGSSLSNALEKWKRYIGCFTINLVRVGEISGTLPENLEYIALELKQRHDLHKQIIGALIYPFIIILSTISITIFLMIYIFPKIVPIFLSLNTALPFSTRLLIGMSQFIINYGFMVLGIIIVAMICYRFVHKINSIKNIKDKLWLQVPIFGKLCQYYNVATCLRTMGILLRSDVRITEAISITATSTNHNHYQAALLYVQSQVVRGQTISQSLKTFPNLFPPLVIQMIHAGEMTGNLSTTLTYLSTMYEAEIKEWTKNLSVVLEPLLMLLMGLCVGFIAISIITPIYGITQNVHP